MCQSILNYVKQRVKPKTYNSGEIIFNQGDPSDGIYYLEEGCALVYAILPDGKEKNVMFNWGGQAIGLSVFFEHVPHRAYAIAIHPCVIYLVSTELMLECLAQVPSAKDEIIENLCSDISALFDKVADSALAGTEIRVARFVCRRMAKGQCEYHGEFPVLKFTQDYIADVVGISRSLVSDALSRFAKNGWLTPGYGHITILNPKAIQAYAYG